MKLLILFSFLLTPFSVDAAEYEVDDYILPNGRHHRLCNKEISVYFQWENTALVNAVFDAVDYWNSQNIGINFIIWDITNTTDYLYILAEKEDFKNKEDRWRLGRYRPKYKDSAVCINSGFIAIYPRAFKTSQVFLNTIVRHEMGHAVGLKHTNSKISKKTLMAPYLSVKDVIDGELELHELEKVYLDLLYSNQIFRE